MVTRRELVQLAAALGIGRTIVPHLSRAEAAIDGAYPIPPSTYPIWEHTVDATSPAGFAERAIGQISGEGELLGMLVENAVAKELAEYHAARGMLVDAMPALAQMPYPNPWAELDEAVMPLYVNAFEAGVRIGAEMERLRLVTITPNVQCQRCQSIGTLDADGGWDVYHSHFQVCPDCQGEGYLPNPLYGTVRHGA